MPLSYLCQINIGKNAWNLMRLPCLGIPGCLPKGAEQIPAAAPKPIRLLPEFLPGFRVCPVFRRKSNFTHGARWERSSARLGVCHPERLGGISKN